MDDMDFSDLNGRNSRMLGRRANSQMNVSLPIELHEQLRNIAWHRRLSLSHLCRVLLVKGLEIWEKEQGAQREKARADAEGE